MRHLLWPSVWLLVGCESIYMDNPRNCVLNQDACADTERCNTVTQQCESADCRKNPALCTINEQCDMQLSRCVPFTFVLGQPDESSNVNAAYGQSAPQAALLIPNGDGTSKVVVGDTNNHRILIWNTVPPSNTVPSAVLGIPEARTLSGLAPYGGVTETSTSAPWSLTSTDTGLMLGDRLLNRLLTWEKIPTQPSTGAEPTPSLWGQQSSDMQSANGGGKVSPFGVSSPKIFFEPAFSTFNARVFISDSDNNRILIFENGVPTTANTAPTKILGQQSFLTNIPGSTRTTLRSPRGIAANANTVFVADWGNHRVIGVGYGQWSGNNASVANYLIGQPNFVSSQENRGQMMPSEQTLSYPESVAVCQGSLFIADSGNHRVLRFSSPTFIPVNPGALPQEAATLVLGQADFTGRQPNRNGAPGAGTMNSPSDVRCDSQRLIVADTGNHRTLIWNDLTTLTSGKSADVILGQPDASSAVANMPAPDKVLHFNNPSDVATDGKTLALADTGNHRVLLWLTLPRSGTTPPDVVLGQTSLQANQQSPTSASTLSAPSGVALEGGRLAVADTDNNRVLIWNTLPTVSGTPANVVIGQANFTDSILSDDPLGRLLARPQGVALAESVLYVTDANHNRALIYPTQAQNNPTATIMLGQPGASSRSAKTLADPRGIKVSQGQLLIADRGNQRVLLWSKLPTVSGQAADRVIGQDNFTSASVKVNRDTLNQPHGILFHAGRLFVSEEAHNRVLYWKGIPTEDGALAYNEPLGQKDFFSTLPNAPDIPSKLQQLSSPGGLAAFDSQLFIADTLNNRLVVRAVPEP